jgi:hypothetical protein
MTSRLGNGRRLWWRRLRKANFNETLHDVSGPRYPNPEARQQRKAERELDENDRGERKQAFPRPNRAFTLCVSGHWAPASHR